MIDVGVKRKEWFSEVQIPVLQVPFLHRDPFEALDKFVVEAFNFAVRLRVRGARLVVIDAVALDRSQKFLFFTIDSGRVGS